jgi:hypothetical protein
VTVFRDAMYLTGGYHINSHETESEVWISTDGLNWEKRIPEWSSRHGHISLSYKGRLWVIGGWHEIPEQRINHGVNDTWFTEDGLKWFKTTTDGPWTGLDGKITWVKYSEAGCGLQEEWILMRSGAVKCIIWR